MTVEDYYEEALRERAERQARRNANRNRSKANPKPRKRKRAPEGYRPFCGVDGEGGGKDGLGRQYYRLLRAHGGGVDQLLFRDNEPLGAGDCLEFIASLPAGPIYVGYGFGYDSTQILRGLPADRIAAIFAPRKPDRFHHAVYWRNYAIDYLPGQYLSVGRTAWRWDAEHNKEIPYTIKGSTRTILETLGFFQGPYVKALEEWDIGSKHVRDKIAGTKKERDQFELMTPELLTYNKQECRWLAQLMERFRQVCEGVDLVLPANKWNGAGKLAELLHRQHGCPKRTWLEKKLDPWLRDAAKHAYFGGRAELLRVGGAPAVYSYDLKSAYPAAMLDLPCLEHGTWEKIDGQAAAGLTEGTVAMVDIEYGHDATTPLCGLPWRYTDGYLVYPRFGAGIYWKIEVDAAIRYGTQVRRYNGGWLYHRHCDCRPFDYVAELFAERKRLDRWQKGAGIPLKLAINSLYGKLAQRIGGAPYQNHIWAGLITATTRARILDAVGSAADRRDIIAIATDGIYSASPLPLDMGDELGNWEESEMGQMFFAQAGFYWQREPAGVTRTRGMSRDNLGTKTRRLEAAWETMTARLTDKAGRVPRYPAVRVGNKIFMGLKLAHSQGNLDLAGQWVQAGFEPKDESKDEFELTGEDDELGTRVISFAWGEKREELTYSARYEGPAGGALQTSPKRGTPRKRSAPWHSDALEEGKLHLDLLRIIAEEQPDYFDPDAE